MPPCLPLTGSKLFPPPCFLSTGGLHRPYITVFPIIFFIARCQITHSFEFLVACAIRTSVPQLPTNCLLAQQRVSSSVTLLPRRATGALIFPLARSSSLATLFLMRLTFRLRLPSPDRTRLTFCCRTYSPRLPRLPQTLGTRGPRSCRLHLPRTMPATLSGWTRPSCGMVLPTGCPRCPGRLRLCCRLLHHPVPAPAPQLLTPGPDSGSVSTTAVVRVQPRLHSRSRRFHRPWSRRQWCSRLQHRRRQRPGLQSPLHGRLVPGRAPCRRPCSGTASLRQPPAWRRRCQATPAPRSPMQIGARR